MTENERAPIGEAEKELVEKLAVAIGFTDNWETADENDKVLWRKDIEETELPLIRSHANSLVAAAVEACVKHDPTVRLDESGDRPHAYVVCDCGWDGRRKLPWDIESWKAHIRSTVTSEAAAHELERIKAAARLEILEEVEKLMLSWALRATDAANGKVTGSVRAEIQLCIDDGKKLVAALEAAARKEEQKP